MVLLTAPIQALRFDGSFAPAWVAYGHAFAQHDESDQALAASLGLVYHLPCLVGYMLTVDDVLHSFKTNIIGPLKNGDLKTRYLLGSPVFWGYVSFRESMAYVRYLFADEFKIKMLE